MIAKSSKKGQETSKNRTAKKRTGLGSQGMVTCTFYSTIQRPSYPSSGRQEEYLHGVGA